MLISKHIIEKTAEIRRSFAFVNGLIIDKKYFRCYNYIRKECIYVFC